MTILFERSLLGLYLTLSIGLSDGIEYYFNPNVHRVHNCPDIMRMRWKDYKVYHAFMSGVKCSWFLFIPACLILPCSKRIIHMLFWTNISLPFICYMTDMQKKDSFLCHKLLYIVNAFGVIASSLIRLFE